MNKVIKWLNWLDNNLIKILLIIFIFLVPLYPKLPLRMINYTYIAIRLEDIYLTFLLIVFAIQVLRKKISLNFQFLTLFGIFWLAVFLSTVFGIYIQKTIALPHLGWLHAVRRVEYMSVFFIAFSVIKTKKDFPHLFISALIVIGFVGVYGLGQKFFGWPAVQTMNPEYAKGYLLFLTPEARISSTFAGHYDLAAYLVFFIPLIIGCYFLKQQLRYLFLFFLSLTILIITASRISYISYLISVFTFLIFLRKPKFLILTLVLTLGLTSLSKNLTSRLKRTFQVKRVFINEKTGQTILLQKITTKELPAGTFFLPIDDSTSVRQPTQPGEQLMVKEKILEEIRIKAKKEGKTLTKQEEDTLFASIAASLKPITKIASDISFATRLQIEWPRAIAAFVKNPLLGSGPSSITEATDNDYLRWLGEFGLLGTISFMTILLMIIKKVFEKIKTLTKSSSIFLSGFLFAVFGLLINASYIDVFEASKVAYTFWIISGIFIGLTQLRVKNI